MDEYQICQRCVMDTTAINITFDEHGFCNYCNDFTKKLADIHEKNLNSIASKDKFIERIKSLGKGKEYDCIIGVSGGVDSSYVLYLAVKHGLRPLAVHLDNGWNSELASHNISNLISALGVDLYTHVINWHENRDLQLSFIKANVVDIEMLMDNAMLALNYKMAASYGIKYILSGVNSATEGMNMPTAWNHLKFDKRNIKSIHQTFGQQKIKTHPLISTFDYIWYEYVRGIKWIPFLDYFEFNKENAVKTLMESCNYKPYPYKHYESVFTRFYQAFILPHKFKIDKRRLHLSTLIVSGQMTREDAMTLLSQPTYESKEQEKQDIKFVLKKLELSELDFEQYLQAPRVEHNFYKTEEPIWNAFKDIYFKYIKGVIPA